MVGVTAMNRIRIQIALLALIVALSISLGIPGQTQPLYRVQVTEQPQGPLMIDLLERVQTQVPQAFMTRQGNTDVIQAGSFSDPQGALRRQQQLEQLGITVQITSSDGQPIALLEPPTLSPGPIEDLPFHFPYRVISEGLLQGISSNHRLHPDAAQAFQRMRTAAQADGISLRPLSGYRSWQTQAFLFQRQIQRRGSEIAAKRLSAPPGHSEHHTGYAIDIGDPRSPGTDLQFSFDRTAGFQWLATQARSYGFELSFPPNNPQGVSYEPWHWRFVQTPEAQAIFAPARQMQTGDPQA